MEPADLPVRVLLLGVPSLERGSVPVHMDTRKALALLAYLALSEGRQSREILASLLWADYEPARARAALRRTLSTLRASVGESRLETDRHLITLDRAQVYVDAVELQSLVRRVHAHGHPVSEACATCLPLLEEAAELYRGDFLAGFSLRDAPDFDDWQTMHSEALRRDFADLLEGLVHGLAQVHRLDDALRYARRWLELDPLHEPAHRALMQIYCASGQRSAALRQYRDCVRVLERELAVPPVEETTRLYVTIKEQGETPGPQPTPAPPLEPAVNPGNPTQLPLVGRTDEWKMLAQAYDAMTTKGFVVTLEGEAGVGKTRLMDEFLHHARASGSPVVAVRCYEGETALAYASIAQLLRGVTEVLQQSGEIPAVSPHHLAEVSRLLPEIRTLRPDIPTPPPLDNLGAKTRFLDGITRVLFWGTKSGSLILAVDDMQWADASTIEWLEYVLRRLREWRAGMVLAWRSEGFPPDHMVRRVLTGAVAEGLATQLRLERLDRGSVLELVHTVDAGARRDVNLADWLFEETEGLPLFLAEYLTAIRSGSAGDAVPRGVRDLLLSRVASVGESGWQFLTAAAVIGRSFDFDILRETSGRDEEMTVSALEELSAQGLVLEIDGQRGETPRYDFSHDKLRELVYDRASTARRRLLHRRVAESLIAGARSREAESAAGQIAFHCERAGQTALAASYYRRAGDHARGLYANREALAHFDRALTLGDPDVGNLHEACGDLHTLLGEYPAAVARYESAAALAEGVDLARIEHKLGTVHQRWGEWELAESYFEAGLTTLGAGGSPAQRANLYADWSLTAYHRGHGERAFNLARTALSLAQEDESTEALARAHTVLGILESNLGNRESAHAHLRRSVALAQDTGVRTAALHNLALLSLQDGDTTSAEDLALESLALSISRGERHREAALHNTLADLLHARGQRDEAMTHLKQAVTIYAEIGVDEGAVREKVWKLTEW